MNYLNESKKKPTIYGEWLFIAIAIGFFLLLVGTLFVLTPNLFSEIFDFFQSFGLVDVPNTDIVFLAPEFPRSHLTVYQAVGQFSIAVCLFQIVLLALRFFVHSSWSKRAETVGNLVYWGGAAFLIQTFLIENTQWFTFWSTILIVIGVSMIARAVVMAISRI